METTADPTEDVVAALLALGAQDLETQVQREARRHNQQARDLAERAASLCGLDTNWPISLRKLVGIQAIGKGLIEGGEFTFLDAVLLSGFGVVEGADGALLAVKN